MPRTARLVLTGLPHHVTQRGNYRQLVFAEERDWLQYLFWMNKYSQQFRTKILAYCLMPNHVHFIVVPGEPLALARTFHATHTIYARYFHRKNQKSQTVGGHLWQGRFYSCVLDEAHLAAAVRYVEMNPVRAKLAEEAWKWPWSTAAFHAGLAKAMITLADIQEYLPVSTGHWKDYLSSYQEEKEMDLIRQSTQIGRPVGEGAFIDQLEQVFGRKFRDGERGRPRKKEIGVCHKL